jgi:hypothetical protein
MAERANGTINGAKHHYHTLKNASDRALPRTAKLAEARGDTSPPNFKTSVSIKKEKNLTFFRFSPKT